MSGGEHALRDGLPSGTELGEYVIEAAIGQGGFGVVYRASHRYLGTVVALKEYLPATVAVRTEGRVCPRNQSVAADYEEGLRRFIDEARHLVQFRSHPGVVTCVGFFEERGTAYMAMEYEEGLPLSELLTKREAAGAPLDEGELLRLAEQVLESLAAVHQAGVLHRDIKPSNILIRKSDDRPVLIDFGAAKEDFVQYSKSSAPHTQGYAAIEQMEADGKLGPWTDLYGLGAVMWRIVAGGNKPFEPCVPVDPLSRMVAGFRGQEDPLPSARRLGTGRFSIAVLEAIDKCLELEPRDRPADCRELLRMLSVRSRKDLVESSHLNEGKDESGRDERAPGEDGQLDQQSELASADRMLADTSAQSSRRYLRTPLLFGVASGVPLLIAFSILIGYDLTWMDTWEGIGIVSSVFGFGVCFISLMSAILGLVSEQLLDESTWSLKRWIPPLMIGFLASIISTFLMIAIWDPSEEKLLFLVPPVWCISGMLISTLSRWLMIRID